MAADAVESLSGEPLLHVAHTHDGARAACMALAWGTPKDRKKAVKAMKVRAWGLGACFWATSGAPATRREEALPAPSPCFHCCCPRSRSCPPPAHTPPPPPPQGHVPALARDEWGHLVLITALSVVDDTTLLRKGIVAELQVCVRGRARLPGARAWRRTAQHTHMSERLREQGGGPRKIPVDGRTEYKSD